MVQLVAALCLSVAAESGSPAADEARTYQRVVGLLQYIEGDYAEAMKSGDAAEIAEQTGFAHEAVSSLETVKDATALERAKAVQALIEAKAAAPQVQAACHELAADLIRQHEVPQRPRHIVSLERGAEVFQQQCAACHGATGKGDGPAGKALDPAPASFHDAERMGALTPFKVFNTTTFGVTGTGMPPFPTLTDDDRWNAAFYVFTLRLPACAKPSTPLSIDALSTTTDAELARDLGGEAAVACARRTLPKADVAVAIAQTHTAVEQALELWKAGKRTETRQAIVDAYLNGIEPVEPTLRARSPEMVAQIEEAFTAARVAAEHGENFEQASETLLTTLRTAERAARPSDFWSVFFAAIFILLREGFEATVVVGALLAVMKKMNATEHVRLVHAGWVSALVASAIAFVFGHSLLAGANREWMETVVSLIAVGMLVYAAIWLNARANVSKFMGEMREKMKSAMSTGSAWGLFAISFSSVGRETFETALFLEGLAGDSWSGVAWGSAAGLVLLVGLVFFVRTVGFVLPMKTLFNASTVLLLATAVMLVGKGVHGLQELGIVTLHPVSFVSLPALGIFPDAMSLSAQLLLSIAPLVWWLVTKRKNKRGDGSLRPSANAEV